MSPEIPNSSRSGSRHQPERTRRAILDAAIAEFAAEGAAGARIDSIAQAAGVNKALVYYYFRDKDGLHGAVIDHVFQGLSRALKEQLDRDISPAEKVLACAGAHFDYIAGAPLFPRVIMHEMTRMNRDGSPHLDRVVEQYFRPVFRRMAEVIRDGIERGQFRAVDPGQFLPSLVAITVFYFTSSPVIRMISGIDPLSPERLAARRAAVLDFISAALFTRSTPEGAGA